MAAPDLNPFRDRAPWLVILFGGTPALAALTKIDGVETSDKWTEQTAKYKNELPEMKAKAEELEHDSHHRQEESHHFHERGTRFDLGELGIELALVLCSIAVLTKRAVFWYSGGGVGLIGAAVSVSAFLIH